MVLLCPTCCRPMLQGPNAIWLFAAETQGKGAEGANLPSAACQEEGQGQEGLFCLLPLRRISKGRQGVARSACRAGSLVMCGVVGFCVAEQGCLEEGPVVFHDTCVAPVNLVAQRARLVQFGPCLLCAEPSMCEGL